jgi:metallo-beta-lactamase family protein
MLTDAAMIQAADARHVNRLIERDGADMIPVEPLYSEENVAEALSAFVSVGYRRPQRIAEGIRLTLLDAGHVLGSALIVLDIDDVGQTKRIVFSGDLGRKGTPLLEDPEVPEGAELLLLESTYGDREHDSFEAMDDALLEVLKKAHAQGGKVIIPSFALERAQEIIFALKRLKVAGRLPPMPVYVDSPLTVRITEVFQLHTECLDADVRTLLRGRESPFEFPNLHYISDKRESQALDRELGPSVIISASGMCEGGRVLHHLQATVEDPKNSVVIVGFQAQHTLGRRLVERRERVRIFGVEHELRAGVTVLNGFSAHADRTGLLEFAEAVRARGPLRQVALVHGEPQAQRALRAELEKRGFPTVHCPLPGTRIEL